MLTSHDVILAYKLILGREPESPAIVENFVRHSDFDHLRRTLLSSGEFAERLSRDPGLLAMPMAALTMTEEVRRYQSLLEALVGLALPVWDRSVLVVGDEASNLAGFFLDRQCKVSIAASAETAALLRKLLSDRQFHAANTSFVSLDQSGTIGDESLNRFDLVYGELPDDSSDVMRAWLDDAAEACAGTLIATCNTAPGRSEDVFLTPARTSGRFRTVPTKKWVYARLRERFEHVYEPVHTAATSSLLQGRPVETSETLTTYVAARIPLTSPALEEYVGAAPSSPRVPNRIPVAVTRM